MTTSNELFAIADRIDPNKDYHAELVGEGKKFKTDQDLARSVAEKDLFIPQLQRELAELREDLSKRKTVEEVLGTLQQTPIQPKVGEPAAGGSENTALNEETIGKLVREQVSNTLQQHTAETAAKQNVDLVVNTLTQVWGADYATKLEEATAALGVSKDFATSLARSQPKVLLKLIGADQPKPVDAASNSLFQPSGMGVNAAALSNARNSAIPEQERYSYWQKVRKENPNLYHSPQAATARFNAAKKHGDAFYSF